METPQKIFVAIGTIAVVGLAVIGGKVLFSDNGTTQQNTGSVSSLSATNGRGSAVASPLAATNQNTTTPTAVTYKDGTYKIAQQYMVPHGEVNSVAVTLTIANGKISAVNTSDTYTDRESGMYIDSFESEVSSSASGQPLSSYSPSRIGGASLTTDAFARAIDTIRSQAAA